MAEKLNGLRVLELRAELDARGLDKTGVKRDLVFRLAKALESEGTDIEQYYKQFTETKLPKKGPKPNPMDVEIIEIADSDSTNKSDEKKLSEQVPDKEKPVNPDNSLQTLDADAVIIDEDISKEEETVASESDGKNATTSEQEVEDQVSKDPTAANAPPQQTAMQSQGPSDDGTSTSNGQTDDKKQKKNPNERVLWIMNVPKGTAARQLKHLIAPWGAAQAIKLVINTRFPGSTYGYAVMASVTDATNVINKLNNTEFRGRILKIATFDNQKKRKLMMGEKSNNSAEDIEEVVDVEEFVETSTSQHRPKSRVSDRSSQNRRRSQSQELVEKSNRPQPEYHGGYSSILTFDKIKEERERQRMRERERAEREESRRRREEEMRMREMEEITRRQRSEAERLQREREKLRMERDKIEREKSELLKLERDRQKLEREKLELEKIELLRTRQRLEEDRRTVKRPIPERFRVEESFHERKRINSNTDIGAQLNYEPSFKTSTPVQQSTFASTKEFKRMPFNKQETFVDKRSIEFNSERLHHHAHVNRPNPGIKFESRNFHNVGNRETRSGPPRDMDRPSKDNRFMDRNRPTQFRPMWDNRVSSQNKPNKPHFLEHNANRFQQSSGSQQKFGSNHKFGMSNQSTWGSKGSEWRPTNERWNSNTNLGRSANQQSAGGSTSGLVCPPPPGISNSFNDRFHFNKSGGNRKY